MLLDSARNDTINISMAEAPTAANIFVHPQALCEASAIGENTRIWAFAHVLPGATIGKDCNICDHVFIENDVVVGDRVTIKCGVQLWDGLRVADDVFIGPNVTFSNDKYPEEQAVSAEGRRNLHRTRCVDRRRCIDSAGLADRRSRDGRRGRRRHARRPGARGRVRQSRTDRRLRRYQTWSAGSAEDRCRARTSSIRETSVSGVTVHRLPVFADLRGSLSVGEFPQQVPFVPKRYFIVFDVPGKDVRGEHAHRRCHQFLVCLRGSLSVVVDDGTSSEEIVLDRPSIGLYLPPMIWAVQYRYSADALLLVFASDPYDAGDYIRDYDEFLSAIGGAASA